MILIIFFYMNIRKYTYNADEERIGFSNVLIYIIKI